MMQPWFPEAKLGIFIHWGIYAVKGISESWAFFTGQISYDDYMAQRHCFGAEKYDPVAWADLFRRSGAKYVVLTTKHHDGVALYDTQLSDLSTVKATPAKRDLIGPYTEAMRDAGLKVGYYFSHLDWSHPSYAPIPPSERNGKTLTFGPAESTYSKWEQGKDQPEWLEFIQFRDGQLEELCTRYGKIDLLWFDGDWTPAGDDWWRMSALRDKLHAWQPDVILNSRMAGHGDYATPEQGQPVRAPEGPWEFCMTVNDSWGYQTGDHNHKTPRQLVRIFTEIIGLGGNLLLDIGPYADGSLQPEQVERLETLGAWIEKHAEAVYPTVAGLPPGLFHGASTFTKEKDTLYLYFYDRPVDEIAVKGVRGKVKKVSVVGSGAELPHRRIGGAEWTDIPGTLWITVPAAELDPLATVVKVEFEAPVTLYTG